MNARAKQVAKILIGFEVGDRVIVRGVLGCPKIKGRGMIVPLPFGVSPGGSLYVKLDSWHSWGWWCDPAMVEIE